MKVECMWCSGKFEHQEQGFTHEYIQSTPGCWEAYCDLLNAQWDNYQLYSEVNQILVDTYAVQHPGIPSRKSTQSVIGHLVSLYYFHERGLDGVQSRSRLKKFVEKKFALTWLAPPNFKKSMNIGEILAVKSVEMRINMIKKWSSEVWNLWKSMHRETIETYIHLFENKD